MRLLGREAHSARPYHAQCQDVRRLAARASPGAAAQPDRSHGSPHCLPDDGVELSSSADLSTIHFSLKHNCRSVAAFDPALGRECGTAFDPPLRYKPYPDSLLHVCKTWGIQPSEAMFVGDSARDDVSDLLQLVFM